MRVFLSVGEPSGDLHGANLIRRLRELDPQIECRAFGGPRMQEAGADLLADMTDWGVMWFAGALAKLPRYYRLYRAAVNEFQQRPPDAVVLIDYPGFNWWVARAAKQSGVPVFYYGAPQLWGWAAWRIHKMRRLVDHVLCKLPFEAEWYRERGCNAHYVGHPYFDELAAQTPDERFLADLESRLAGKRLLTLLPGSRTLEVRNNLPQMLRAAQRVQEQVANVHVAVASYNGAQAKLAEQLAAECGADFEIAVGRTADLIRRSHCCLACSGSVSLELLYHEKPAAIVYKVNRFVYNLVRAFVIKVRYITLVNLLASDDRFESGPPSAEGFARLPFPEYPTWRDESPQLAAHVVQWMKEPAAYATARDRLHGLKQQFAQAGASATAADYIAEQLGLRPSVARAA